jgi:hypothetical protein
VNEFDERGLVNIAIDPAFTRNRAVDDAPGTGPSWSIDPRRRGTAQKMKVGTTALIPGDDFAVPLGVGQQRLRQLPQMWCHVPAAAATGAEAAAVSAGQASEPV